MDAEKALKEVIFCRVVHGRHGVLLCLRVGGRGREAEAKDAVEQGGKEPHAFPASGRRKGTAGEIVGKAAKSTHERTRAAQKIVKIVASDPSLPRSS